MSKRTYHPDRGDVVEMNFQPASGREIDKRRPAIVISTLEYNRKSGLCIVVPTSTDLSPGPQWLPMPAGLLPRPSMILCDYVKSFDYRERAITFLGRISDQLVQDIVSNLLDVLDPIG